MPVTIGAKPALGEQDSSRFRELAGQLGTLYERHIHVEDRELFPRAHSILTGEHLTAIGHEMAKRRGLAMSPSSVPLQHDLQPSGVATPPRPNSTMDKE